LNSGIVPERMDRTKRLERGFVVVCSKSTSKIAPEKYQLSLLGYP
jgi:hypothetical protein